jgi:riboflavin kinase/FMN adenylyltransferase
VVTLGNFDGVHRGHQAVLATLLETARRHDLPSVAVTFEPHPVAVLHPERAPELLAPGRLREDLLAATGIDGLLVLDFTPEFAAQTPEEFVRSIFVRALGARVVVVGVDTRFGYRNSGDVAILRDLGERLGFEVLAIEDLGDEERWSSTAVRHHLARAEVAEAAAILGRPHRVVGVVVHGHHRGRALGYPTANLAADSLGLVPAEGVYAGWLTRTDLAEGELDRTLPAAISIGTNPTFGDDDRRTVEAYVLDRDDLDLYGRLVAVRFVRRLRGQERFDSVEALITQMARDVDAARRALASDGANRRNW